MAESRVETQVLWDGSAESVTITSNILKWSEFVPLNVGDWDGGLQVSADNAGTPTSGDVCNVYIAYSYGDVLGGGSNTLDTDKNAQFLIQLDTYSTAGEDPARKSVPIRTGAIGYKLGVLCPAASSRNIVVRARMATHRAQ